MTMSKVLLSVALALAAGMAEAQKNTSGGGGAPPVPTPGSDTLLFASDGQTIVDAIQVLGHTATLGADNLGDPMISGEIDGTSYRIFFYGCVEHMNCQWMMFQAGFDMPNGWTLEAANDWHAGRILSDVWLDAEMDPFIEFFVTAEGGLTQANFADVMEYWQTILSDFKTTIGF